MIDVLSSVAEVVTSILAIVGGLKVLARYTPWQWDDKIFAVLESPVKWLKKGK